MPNKLLVRNPYLNEFVWDLLYNVTMEQKKKLSKPFLQILKSPIKCKNFAEFSTLDEKVRFLSELGMDCSIVFFQDKIQSMNRLKVILEKYEEDKQVAASKEITQLKVFVSSDKQVKWLLGLMADTIHHKSYFLNLEYNRAVYHVKKWDRNRHTPESKELNETIESSDFVAKFLISAFNSLGTVSSFLEVTQYDIKILLYLYNYRHLYLEKARIWDYFSGDITKGNVTTCLKRLFLNEYIRKHADYRILKYSITGSGIQMVNQFMSRVLKSTQFT